MGKDKKRVPQFHNTDFQAFKVPQVVGICGN